MGILILLILLQIVHFFADFTHLSTDWMLKAKSIGKPFFPILCHGLVHGALVFLVLTMFVPLYVAILLGFGLEAPLHTLIDIGKGKLSEKYPFLADNKNKWHWWLFGADQYLHFLTKIIIAAIALIAYA